jgi:DNA-binding Lrp family transcriptional regulator
MSHSQLSLLDKQLLNDFQREFPLWDRPFEMIANRLGVSESEVLRRFKHLQKTGLIHRIGATVRPHAAGASTLAAMAVPTERLQEVADIVSAFAEVNHNYERTHRYNLWFVVIAANEKQLSEVLSEIMEMTGLDVLDLPMEEAFHLDLGFQLSWN